jgi:hypothetical protein
MMAVGHRRRFKQAARFRFSSDSAHIAASHRSATKSADARRGAADGGEFRQAAGAVASVATDKRGVTMLQPQTLQCTICREGQKPKFIKGFALTRAPVIRLLLVIQVPHASDKGSMALLSCPIDGFVLGLEGGEDAAADAHGIGLGPSDG